MYIPVVFFFFTHIKFLSALPFRGHRDGTLQQQQQCSRADSPYYLFSYDYHSRRGGVQNNSVYSNTCIHASARAIVRNDRRKYARVFRVLYIYFFIFYIINFIWRQNQRVRVAEAVASLPPVTEHERYCFHRQFKTISVTVFLAVGVKAIGRPARIV